LGYVKVVRDRLLLFLEPLDAFDEGAQLASGNGLAAIGYVVGHLYFSMLLLCAATRVPQVVFSGVRCPTAV
jgi:hypothetical protein